MSETDWLLTKQPAEHINQIFKDLWLGGVKCEDAAFSQVKHFFINKPEH